MLYTKDSIRFTTAEADAYLAQGIDVTQINSYRQFAQIIRKQQRQRQRRENTKMGKRYGRKALNGTTEYYDSQEECLAAQRREIAIVRDVFFGIVGAIAGGIVIYMLLRWLHVDSKLIRFAAVIVGIWFCGMVSAALSELLWRILKWVLLIAMVAALCFLIYKAV